MKTHKTVVIYTSMIRSKEELRVLYKKKRRALSDVEIETANAFLMERLKALDFSAVQFLHIYLPILKLREYNTFPFISWLKSTQPQIKIVVSKSYFETGLLRHFVLDNHTNIEENAWGIPEPVHQDISEEVFPKQLDMIIIPLLVCDLVGNRIGYGKGFYDRFLLQCTPLVKKIGISYFPPIPSIASTDPWDIPLDTLLFPNGTISFHE